MEMDEEFAMKRMVVSALAYYGLKVLHVFDGCEFKACFKPIEIDKQKAVEEFTAAASATTCEILEKFARECCRADPSLSTPSAQPRELQSQLVPQPVLRLVAPALAQQGKGYSSSSSSRIRATLSTFVKDYSGHYVSPYRDGKCVNVEKKVNGAVQLQGQLQVAKAETGTGHMVQNTNFNRPPALGASFLPYSPAEIRNGYVMQNVHVNRPPAVGASFLPFSPAGIRTGNLTQNIHVNRPPAARAPFLSYSPIKDYSAPRRDGGCQSPIRKRDAAHHEESEYCEAKRLKLQSGGEGIEKTTCIGVLQGESDHCEAKRLRVESVGEEIEKATEPGTWQENLAKEWPDIFQEMEEHVKTDIKQTEMEERSKCAYPPSDVPTLIEVETGDLNNMQESPYLERKRKRERAQDEKASGDLNNMEETPYLEKKRKKERATDEKACGGTVLNDSSLESIGREKDQVNHFEVLEADSTICAGDEEKNKESEVGSNRTTLDADLDVTGQKRNRTSWPAPLYGDQARAKSSLDLQSFENREGDICAHELQVDRDICAHELQGEALDTCPVCKGKEEVAFAKYTRLFKDDPTWKQKFLDGENLTCDICSSKGKVTTFSDVALLLSHARKGLELRGPEHRGYAKAIHSLMQLSEPGNLRTCHSAVGQTTPSKRKRVWPPVIVLENTFDASDRCEDPKDLDKEVTRRLKAFVNVEVLTLRKVSVNGHFQGTILVQFPPTQRGSNDANRLHQYFLLSGRSLQEWMRVRNKPSALMPSATGVEENFDLVKIGESGEIRSRIYFGYQATIKIMTRLDPRRQFVKWRVREGQMVENR